MKLFVVVVLIWVKKREAGEQPCTWKENQVQRPLRLEGILVSVRKGESGSREFSEGETEDGQDLDGGTMQGLVGHVEYLGLCPNCNGRLLKAFTGEVVTGLCFETIMYSLSGKGMYRKAKV